MSITRLSSSPSYTLYQKLPIIGPRGVLLGVPPVPPFVPDFFVSPTGSSSNPGTLFSPWSLAYALSGAGGAITPGKQIALLGGTYTGAFVGSTNGTALSPIIFRRYTGARVSIDGTLYLTGDYNWIWGWEILRSNPLSSNGNAFLDDGLQNKLINCIVHDSANVGIAENNNGRGGEIYGCLSYNNGTHFNLDHGMYLHGALTDPIKYVLNNIVFNNWANGIQLYVQSFANWHLYLDSNVVFGSGSISSPVNNDANLLLSGTVGGDIKFTNNMTYEPASKNNVHFFNDAGGDDLLLDGNYLAGGNNKCLYLVGGWNAATVRNNVLHCPGGQLVLTPAGVSGWAWQNNAHYRDPTVVAWTHASVNYSYSNWKVASGLGASDTNPGTTPTGVKVVVTRNTYEVGRGHIVIYNWDHLATVNVDLSSVLSLGYNYEIVNAQDYYGPIVATGIYSGALVSLPMAGITPVAPVGRTYTPAPVTGPEFQVFVVRIKET